MSDIRARIDASPMSRAQILAVAITFLLSALDGYDVLSVSFAAPAITADWDIGRASLGIVLSAGLVGMALGAFFIAPIADNLGRKRMVIVALVLMAIGMLASGFSSSIIELSIWRVVTGLGIGACVSIINPIAAEFANAQQRPLTVAIMAIGYPVGGVVGGLGASLLLAHFSWPAVFFAGFVAAVLMLPLVVFALPESIAFLLTRGEKGDLKAINSVLSRFGLPPLTELPPVPPVAKRGYAAIFSQEQLGATVWLSLVNILFVFTVYYLLSWLPQMVADAGFDAATATLVSAISSLSGVVGGLLLGFASRGGKLRWLTGGAVFSLGLAALLFGIVPPTFGMLLTAAAICGFFLFGGATGLYATIATTFPDESRASGTGFVSGTGRVASAIAPLVAGWLFATGLGRFEVSSVFSLTALIAGAVLITGWKRFRTL